MPRRCLVLEVRADMACLAIATDVDIETSPPTILPDIAGREHQPLASPWLWSASDDSLSFAKRARLASAVLGRGDYDRDQNEVAHRILTSLFTGVKRYAESRLEREISELLVVIPAVGFDLGDVARTCSTRAGFKTTRTLRRPVAAMIAYGIVEKYCDGSRNSRSLVVDVESDRVTAHVIDVEGIRGSYTAPKYGGDIRGALGAAVDVVLVTTNTEHRQIEDVVVTGSNDDDDVQRHALELLEAHFPSAIVHRSLRLDCVCMHGAMEMMYDRFKPVDLSKCCVMLLVMMTIGVETCRGLVTPICSRNCTIPTLRTTRVRVYAPTDRARVMLRFFEGERAFADANIGIGTLVVRNLVAGWNDIIVRVDINCDEAITINATVRDTTTSTLRLASSSHGMASGEFQALMSAQLAEAEADRALRRPIQARQCTENLVILASTLIDRSSPVELCRPLEVMPLTLYLEENDVDDDLQARLAASLGAVNDWSALSPTEEQSLHDNLLELLGERVQRHRQLGDTCTYCRQRTERSAV